jgi:Flp pilus assembly pilin Flp
MRRFIDDKRGTTFEGLALIASIVALAALATADIFDRLGRSGKLDQFAAWRHNGFATTARPTGTATATGREGVDYSTTATVVRRYSEQRSVLDQAAPARTER